MVLHLRLSWSPHQENHRAHPGLEITPPHTGRGSDAPTESDCEIKALVRKMSRGGSGVWRGNKGKVLLGERMMPPSSQPVSLPAGRVERFLPQVSRGRVRAFTAIPSPTGSRRIILSNVQNSIFSNELPRAFHGHRQQVLSEIVSLFAVTRDQKK